MLRRLRRTLTVSLVTATLALAVGACIPDAPPLVPCRSNPDCTGTNEFCQFTVGNCGGDSGFCVTRPTRCLGDARATCACNGVLYESGCLAAQASQSVHRYPTTGTQCP